MNCVLPVVLWIRFKSIVDPVVGGDVGCAGVKVSQDDDVRCPKPEKGSR